MIRIENDIQQNIENRQVDIFSEDNPSNIGDIPVYPFVNQNLLKKTLREFSENRSKKNSQTNPDLESVAINPAESQPTTLISPVYYKGETNSSEDRGKLLALDPMLKSFEKPYKIVDLMV